MPKYILKDLRGMNATKAALQLPPGDVPLLQNVRARPFHSWAKRRGIEPVDVYTSPINGIFELELDGLIIPIFQSGAALTFFPTVTSASLPNTPDPYQLGDGRTSLAIDPAGVNTLIAGRTGGASTSCSYALSSSSTSIDETQQDITISVTAYAGCSWNASPNDSWLTTVSGSAHLSGGSYTVRAAANAGAARVGTISFYRGSSGSSSLIGTFTVNQASGAGPVPICAPGDWVGTSWSITGYFDGMFSDCGCVATVGTTWNGIMGDFLFPTCAWRNLPTDGQLSFGKTISPGINLDPAVEWIFALKCNSGPPITIWQGTKTFGATPAGVYTRTTGCNVSPATITIA